jgi:hypothetical protein
LTTFLVDLDSNSKRDMGQVKSIPTREQRATFIQADVKSNEMHRAFAERFKKEVVSRLSCHFIIIRSHQCPDCRARHRTYSHSSLPAARAGLTSSQGDYIEPWWYDRHFATVVNIGRAPDIGFRREVMMHEDGSTFAVDWHPGEWVSRA